MSGLHDRLKILLEKQWVDLLEEWGNQIYSETLQFIEMEIKIALAQYVLVDYRSSRITK